MKPDINYGILQDHELSHIRHMIDNELLRRKEKPEEYIKSIYIADGCEGVYIPVDKFEGIDSNDLKEYIWQTIYNGSEIGISIEEYSKEEYEESCKQYEWNFE